MEKIIYSDAKKLLKIITDSTKSFRLWKKFNFEDPYPLVPKNLQNNLKEHLDFLVLKELLLLHPNNVYELTIVGKHYFELKFEELKFFIKRSIFVPIAVSIIATLFVQAILNLVNKG